MSPIILLGLTVSLVEWTTAGCIALVFAWCGYLFGRGRPQQAQSVDQDEMPWVEPGTSPMGGSGREKRLHPRYKTRPFKLRVTCVETGVVLDGLVLNQSLGGLCICVTKSVAAGSTLQLTNLDGLQTGPHAYVQVKHCRGHRGGWALGCQYVPASAETEERTYRQTPSSTDPRWN